MRIFATTLVIVVVWVPQAWGQSAQNAEQLLRKHIHRSGTPALMQRLRERFPALATAWAVEARRLRELSLQSNAPLLRTQRSGCPRSVVTVPVVVHIVHGGGRIDPQLGEVDSIPAARVRALIELVYDDYRRRPYSRAYGMGVDTRIEISLATRDPLGNPHSGVDYVRYQDYGLSSSSLVIDSLIDPTTRLYNMIASRAWPHERYLNIWVLDTLENAEGLGLLPMPPPNLLPPALYYLYLIDGAYIRKGNFIGNESARATITHELGHNLGLLHTFSDLFGVALDCRGTQDADCLTIGDKVCDTPPAIGFSFVPFRANTCRENLSALSGDRPDDRTNYMDYVFDFYMSRFTLGQSQLMLTTLQYAYQRNFLLNPFYLPEDTIVKATGTGKYGVTKANFAIAECMQLPHIVCPGQLIHLLSYSLGDPDTFRWEIRQGSAVVTSVDSGPCAVLRAPSTPGTYNIRLYVKNVGGFSDDTVYTGALVVRDPNQALSFPFSEGFEGSNFPPAGWQIVNPDAQRQFPSDIPPSLLDQLPPANVRWNRYSSPGRGSFGASSSSAHLTNWEFPEQGQQDYLITPLIAIPASAQNPAIEFDVYYRALYWEDMREDLKSYGYLYGDTLTVSISEDCGATWQRLYYKGGEGLDVLGQAIRVINQAPDPERHRAVPPSGRNGVWRHEVVRIPPQYKGKRILVRFEDISGQGNDVYVDSIQIREASIASLAATHALQVSMYPSPASDAIYLMLSDPTVQSLQYRIFSLQGVELIRGNLSISSTQVSPYKIEVGGLPSGLYLLQLEAESGVQSWRFIKE
ncbi:MAG: M43 family zinc metalloprotease [Bacteroidia bacterium]|nr:M43 family zinc metalloprotease [Bacteroidia bacterium]